MYMDAGAADEWASSIGRSDELKEFRETFIQASQACETLDLVPKVKVTKICGELILHRRRPGRAWHIENQRLRVTHILQRGRNAGWHNDCLIIKVLTAREDLVAVRHLQHEARVP